jgi:hypothetical protein
MMLKKGKKEKKNVRQGNKAKPRSSQNLHVREEKKKKKTYLSNIYIYIYIYRIHGLTKGERRRTAKTKRRRKKKKKKTAAGSVAREKKRGKLHFIPLNYPPIFTFTSKVSNVTLEPPPKLSNCDNLTTLTSFFFCFLSQNAPITYFILFY